MTYDVIIIGGGPSGLMASIAASEAGANVLLVDKGSKLGRKLAISGGGRCNVTNAGDIEEIIKNIPGNGRFLYSCLATFNNRDIIRFFEGLGIKLKEEDRGRMFPVSDKAKDVVNALVRQVRKQGVEIRVNAPVKRVLYQGDHVKGVELKNGEIIGASTVIIATGGKSVPYTGSTGDGYAWAQEAGHTITDLYPTEVPITSEEPFIRNKELQGLSLHNITLSVWNPKGKKVIEHEGDMIFTHFGLSGPAALRCSQFVVKLLKKETIHTVLLTIDLFPDKPASLVAEEILKLAAKQPKKAIKNVLKGNIPERMIPLLLRKGDLEEDLTYAHLPKKKLTELAQLIKRFPVQANGTLSIEEAFVTGGGVNLKEVDPKTMQSKLMNGLFFCGEILDIHGYTGGYNITAAFTTGYNAGLNAARQAIRVDRDVVSQ
ncbi:putative Rossmann fold flavoprotein [Caldalkalibacillus uzonensis]|uniref:Rossmann fold flavoprotein n=1 Tax=Caldalkalibacillus uzonensis TaxID=353224 RepID=A0ABU0CR13_9BACI|nr:NAD(P)/FAD-dependent oxidoreductase [Caldalkalibacillus uzonensis]MDQ0338860.1 putative Rossmann fold flavoprotein [Caldalkalibacillus uzonensis]